MTHQEQLRQNINIVKNKLDETLATIAEFKQLAIKRQHYELAAGFRHTEKQLEKARDEFQKNFHPFRLKHGDIALLYFHGLNSDKTSRKFLNLQEHFSAYLNIYCIEWNNNTDIADLLNSIEENFRFREKMVVIGDSTGANFAYQLKERRKNTGKKTALILLNPLLNFEKRQKNIHPFPEKLNPYLAQITAPEDVFLIVSKNDNILNHDYLLQKPFVNSQVLQVNDNHRLSKFKDYISELEEYITTQI